VTRNFPVSPRLNKAWDEVRIVSRLYPKADGAFDFVNNNIGPKPLIFKSAVHCFAVLNSLTGLFTVPLKYVKYIGPSLW